MQESGWYFGGRRRWLLTAVLIFAVLSTARPQVIPGEPPAFPSTDDPRDQFVYERDADDMPVSLVFTCPVTGIAPPTIDWFRGVPGGDFMMDNEFRQEDGSYIFPNITAADSAYASGDGVEYYCTATNDFGTIRSRTVRAFYADFKGFAINGMEVPEGTAPVEREVDVIIAAVATNLQWVSLECEVVPGSTPTPEIQWIGTDTDGDNLEILTEDVDLNTVRFIDGGQWLILETTEAAVTGKVYYCQVTNKQRFQIVRGPITYTLNPVTSFSDEPDGIKIYKPLISRTVPRPVNPDDNDRVAFGVGIAYGGGMARVFTQLWRVNGRTGGTRALAGGPVASILPQLIESDMGPVLDIELVIAPAVEAAELSILSATLTLLDPAVILDPKPENVQDRLSGDRQSFTCNVGGSDPTTKFYHNGNELTDDMDGVEINDSTLTIESTNPDHSGMYQCIVENNSGSDGFSWYLIVRDAIAPKIVKTFNSEPDLCVEFSFIQAESAPVLLSVNVTADPCPTVVWTRNGDPIPEAEATAMGDCADTLGRTSFLFSLMVNELTSDSDDLRAYAATLTNVAGSFSVPGTVVIGRVLANITDLRTDPDSPIEGTDTGCLSAGSTAMIICDNIAFPIATVEFLKNGELIDPNVDKEDRFTQNCETLIITGVTPEDEGTYTCRVQNHPDEQYDDSSDAPLKLDYCVMPSIVGLLTFTRKNPEEGDETTASCGWTGIPDPEVTWYKDGSPLREEELPARIRITMSSDGDMFQSSLQIDNVMPSDTGEYTCNVSNPVGSQSQFSRLEVQEVEELVLSEIATIGIAAGGAGLIVLVAVVMVLLCCVWNCARRSSTGSYAVPLAKDQFQMAVVPGEMPENYNVDAPDGLEEPEEAFNPDYASLPALRPAVPPQYKPTPNYPSDMPPPEEYQKRVPSEDDFVGPYGHDNGGMHHHQPYQPTVDDFVSDDAQFV